MNISTKKLLNTVFVVVVLHQSFVSATHNVSRYFPFWERPEEYTIKNRSHVSASFVYINASTAFRRGGGTGGIPELWGKYDLKDVIESLQAVQGQNVDPIQAVMQSDDYKDKSIKFGVGGKIRSQGILLNYEQNLRWGLQCGASLPVMSLQTTNRFNFDRAGSDAIFNAYNLTDHEMADQEFYVDKIRRKTHQMIGFESNEWNEDGLGDLDLHVRWNHIFDHVLLMRSIDINFQLGTIVPTGFTSYTNAPSSLSIGSNGHWGIYGDFVGALELKQDWTFGLMVGLAHLFEHTRSLRIPVGAEPAIYSALKGRVRMDPGLTLKVSPYFILGNLTDGLDFQVRYTYLRHNQDHWKDARDDKSIRTYFDNPTVVVQKDRLSKWSSDYFTLQLSYDTKTALKKMMLDPVFFVACEIPANGNGVAKTHQVVVGLEMHF